MSELPPRPRLKAHSHLGEYPDLPPKPAAIESSRLLPQPSLICQKSEESMKPEAPAEDDEGLFIASEVLIAGDRRRRAKVTKPTLLASETFIEVTGKSVLC
ncbi:MAG: uncharacterized protein KVP18_001677 [Porospora cf. gigantea A]|uniref:uncharacterized protein n=1 Tax=Porospora cf. gigantea A TaxID=2853593 RepID=UPI00355A161D|nr:MAG: hypothetical protein KVP18_001677 [Porospora cf. gigantea A]